MISKQLFSNIYLQIIKHIYLPLVNPIFFYNGLFTINSLSIFTRHIYEGGAKNGWNL